MQQLLDSSSKAPSYNSGEQGFLNYMIPEFLRCPFFEPDNDSLPPHIPELDEEALDGWDLLEG
jgi:hypothetical protein